MTTKKAGPELGKFLAIGAHILVYDRARGWAEAPRCGLITSGSIEDSIANVTVLTDPVLDQGMPAILQMRGLPILDRKLESFDEIEGYELSSYGIPFNRATTEQMVRGEIPFATSPYQVDDPDDEDEYDEYDEDGPTDKQTGDAADAEVVSAAPAKPLPRRGKAAPKGNAPAPAGKTTAGDKPSPSPSATTSRPIKPTGGTTRRTKPKGR